MIVILTERQVINAVRCVLLAVRFAHLLHELTQREVQFVRRARQYIGFVQAWLRPTITQIACVLNTAHHQHSKEMHEQIAHLNARYEVTILPSPVVTTPSLTCG